MRSILYKIFPSLCAAQEAAAAAAGSTVAAGDQSGVFSPQTAGELNINIIITETIVSYGTGTGVTMF